LSSGSARSLRREGHVTPRLPDASPATQRRQMPVGMGGADRGAGWVTARAFEANRQGSIIAIGRRLADATIVVLGQVIGDDAVDPTIPTPPSARRSCERAELSWCKEGGRSRKFLTFSVVFETHWFAMLASEMNNAKYKFCRKHHSSFVISKGLCSSY